MKVVVLYVIGSLSFIVASINAMQNESIQKLKLIHAWLEINNNEAWVASNSNSEAPTARSYKKFSGRKKQFKRCDSCPAAPTHAPVNSSSSEKQPLLATPH